MRRTIILYDATAGIELVLPITPKQYTISTGSKVNSVSMAAASDRNLPGNQMLFSQTIEFVLPSRSYPFCAAGSNTNPYVALERLQRWSLGHTILRFIVADTPTNCEVLLGPIVRTEKPGSNDLYISTTLYRYLRVTAKAVTTAIAKVNSAQSSPAATTTQATTYTVKRGDTLSAIALRYYGKASYYHKLAAYNGISNPNLILVGQVIQIPALSAL